MDERFDNLRIVGSMKYGKQGAAICKNNTPYSMSLLGSCTNFGRAFPVKQVVIFIFTDLGVQGLTEA
jgi:hypothetical protein